MDTQQKETAQSRLKQAMLAQCGALINLFNDNAKKICVAAMAVVALTGAPTQEAVAGPKTDQLIGMSLGGLIGSRFGEGNGKKAMTVVGAIYGSAVAEAANERQQRERQDARQYQYQQHQNYGSDTGASLSNHERRRLDQMVRESRAEREFYLKSARNAAVYEHHREVARSPEEFRQLTRKMEMSNRDAADSIARLGRQTDKIEQVLNVANGQYGQDVSGYQSDMATIRSTPREGNVRSINTYSEMRTERNNRNYQQDSQFEQTTEETVTVYR